MNYREEKQQLHRMLLHLEISIDQAADECDYANRTHDESAFAKWNALLALAIEQKRTIRQAIAAYDKMVVILQEVKK